jgi:hypothetical protein
MKNLMISVMLLFTSNMISAQNEYKTDMKNSPETSIEIQVGSENVKIIGHAKDEIIITTDFEGSYVDMPSGKKKPVPDRAAGLKPISVSPKDNTGIGLVVDKGGNTFSVLKLSQNAANKTYTFYIPDKAKLFINDLHAQVNTTYNIEAIKGEIEINALNSDISLNSISGPVVANATNGNVIANFMNMKMDQPNSFLSVNGFVDVTLPNNTAADLQLNTVNGEAYTDWDIKVEKDASAAMPVVANMNMFNIEGTINGGGTPVSIQSVNGDIYLRKSK